MTIPPIKLNADWERFFRDEAQFFPPLDQLNDNPQLEAFKVFGQGIWDHRQAEVDYSANLFSNEVEKSEITKRDLKELKSSIYEEVIRGDGTDAEILNRIKKLCE